MESKRRVISLLVDNQSGVLARVSNLFCRRGFNIDSLTVSATNDPAVSRITVTITSDEKALSQLILQTERLEVTRQVFVLDHENSLERELLLLKVAADVHNRSELREIASIYKAKIIDLSPDSMVLELTGRPEKVDAFLKILADYITGVIQIRPMLYLSEKTIAHFAAKERLPVVHNPCPADKNTKRQEVKDLVYELSSRYPDLKERVFGAMQRLPLPEWGPKGRYKRPRDTGER